MQRNKHWHKHKKFLGLNISLDENNQAQQDLGFVDIPPRPHGWISYFTLREDITFRHDAWVFQKIIDICGKKAWRKKNNFHITGEHFQSPYFRELDEYDFDKVPIALRKWFTYRFTKRGYIKWYSIVPNFFFETKVERHYITKIHIIDEVLLQEEAEIESQLYSMYEFGWGYGGGKAPKSYVRGYNQSHRAKEKQAIHRCLKGIKHEFPYRHRHSARWDYW